MHNGFYIQEPKNIHPWYSAASIPCISSHNLSKLEVKCMRKLMGSTFIPPPSLNWKLTRLWALSKCSNAVYKELGMCCDKFYTLVIHRANTDRITL